MPALTTAADYSPTGDQPSAITALADGLRAGDRYQTLLGATGTGKTATMAWIIEEVQKPALVIAHNKASPRGCSEFREFFPRTRSSTSFLLRLLPARGVRRRPTSTSRTRRRTTISRGSGRGDVGPLHPATSSSPGLVTTASARRRRARSCSSRDRGRPDATRCCGSDRLQYVRNDVVSAAALPPKGDILEVQPANAETAYRVSFFGDLVTDHAAIRSPARFASSTTSPSGPPPSTSRRNPRSGAVSGSAAARGRVQKFEADGRMSKRTDQRTEYDLTMQNRLRSGSRTTASSRAARRIASVHAARLLPDDFVVFVDESIRPCRRSAACTRATARAGAGRLRLRLPSALDNRPLRFDEFSRGPQPCSSRPRRARGVRRSSRVAEQLIRPTFRSIPRWSCGRRRTRSTTCSTRSGGAGGRRARAVTTKKMSEDLTDYLLERGEGALSALEIDTLERIQIIRDLRLGELTSSSA